MPRQDKGTLSEKVIRRTVPVIFRHRRAQARQAAHSHRRVYPPRQEGRSEIIIVSNIKKKYMKPRAAHHRAATSEPSARRQRSTFPRQQRPLRLRRQRRVLRRRREITCPPGRRGCNSPGGHKEEYIPLENRHCFFWETRPFFWETFAPYLPSYSAFRTCRTCTKN